MNNMKKEELNQISESFSGLFFGANYHHIPSATITSGIDASVIFVGSHLNIMKDYFRGVALPREGVFAVQPCLRVQNLRSIYDDCKPPTFLSYFPSMGALLEGNQRDSQFEVTRDYLQEIVGFSPEDIKYRVSGKDEDLVALLLRFVPKERLELDSRPPKYYTHVIGEEGVTGRNFNFALRNQATGDFSDVGNFIILEDAQKRFDGEIVEVALGASNILRQKKGYEHVAECYASTELLSNTNHYSEQIKLIDATLASLVLIMEGLRPNGSKNPNRILRNYVRAILFLVKRLKLSPLDFHSIAVDLADHSTPSMPMVDKADAIRLLEAFLVEMELDLLRKSTFSDVEKIVRGVLQ
jgi:hypothetical protein